MGFPTTAIPKIKWHHYLWLWLYPSTNVISHDGDIVTIMKFKTVNENIYILKEKKMSRYDYYLKGRKK